MKIVWSHSYNLKTRRIQLLHLSLQYHNVIVINKENSTRLVLTFDYQKILRQKKVFLSIKESSNYAFIKRKYINSLDNIKFYSIDLSLNPW